MISVEQSWYLLEAVIKTTACISISTVSYHQNCHASSFTCITLQQRVPCNFTSYYSRLQQKIAMHQCCCSRNQRTRRLNEVVQVQGRGFVSKSISYTRYKWLVLMSLYFLISLEHYTDLEWLCSAYLWECLNPSHLITSHTEESRTEYSKAEHGIAEQNFVIQ